MRDNKIHVLTVRFQVYVLLIASISTGLTGLFLREDVFDNIKVILLLTIGLIMLVVFSALAIKNYNKTNDILNRR